MHRERQMCMTSCDNFNYDIEDEYENKSNSISDTRTMSFFMNLNPATHQTIYETNSNHPCFLTNYDGKIIYFNELWYKMFKFMEYEVINEKPSLLHGSLTNKEICVNFTKNLYENDISDMENINYDRYGNAKSVYVSSNRINYNDDISNHIPYFFTTIKMV